MLHDLLRQPLAIDPDRPTLECHGSWTTAAELERLASRLASGLAAMGLEEGDRVAFLLPNSLEAVLCYLVCFRLRLVVVPLDYQYHPLQIGYALGHSSAAILVADRERMPGLDEAGVLGAVPRVVVVGGGGVTTGNRRSFESLLGAERILASDAPHDGTLAAMIYTSGTTSRPKGVVLSHGALATGVRKYLVVRSGNKIAPLEVEAALSEHPAVRECCVIGVPDPASGEAPHAYVILEPGAETRPEDLRGFVASRLADVMVPAEVHLISEMPSKGPGKIDRELLRMRAITAGLIEQVPFFKSASAEFLRDVIPRLEARQFAPGDVLLHE